MAHFQKLANNKKSHEVIIFIKFHEDRTKIHLWPIFESMLFFSPQTLGAKQTTH